MNGIHSRYNELLAKVDISYLADVILNSGSKSEDSELTYIDSEREALANIASLLELIPKEESENLMLEVIDYGVAIQNRYFTYGLACGAKLISGLGK